MPFSVAYWNVPPVAVTCSWYWTPFTLDGPILQSQSVPLYPGGRVTVRDAAPGLSVARPIEVGPSKQALTSSALTTEAVHARARVRVKRRIAILGRVG